MKLRSRGAPFFIPPRDSGEGDCAFARWQGREYPGNAKSAKKACGISAVVLTTKQASRTKRREAAFRHCRGHESERQCRPELKHRATQCVQREYSWLLAALARSRLAHSCPPRRSIITRGRRTTAMITHHRTTATVTDGLGMTARPVGRFRAETAHPTKVRLAADGVVGMGARPVTQFRAALVHHTEVPAKWLEVVLS
jgi:hypothetical protein